MSARQIYITSTSTYADLNFGQADVSGNTYSFNCYLANESLATHYFNAKKFDKALGFYQIAIELNPYYLDPKYGFGKSLLALGRSGDAVKFYKTFLSGEVGFPSDRGGAAQVMLGNLLADYGIALEQTGAREESKMQFQRALKVSPNQEFAKARLNN